MTHLDRLINGRRSIRKYTGTPPPEEWLQQMITAAMTAPSPSNRQPVRFIRLRSPGVRAALQQAMGLGREKLLAEVAESVGSKRRRNWINAYYRFAAFMFEAPALFAVGTSATSLSIAEKLPVVETGVGKPRLSDGRDAVEIDGVQGRKDGRQRDLDISVGLALMGYLLKGEELGLGSCILTAPLIFIEEPEKILSQPRINIRCFLATGYPDEEPAPIRRKEFADIYREI
jgi:nitroreductase